MENRNNVPNEITPKYKSLKNTMYLNIK